jgi:hypothetical protein
MGGGLGGSTTGGFGGTSSGGSSGGGLGTSGGGLSSSGFTSGGAGSSFLGTSTTGGAGFLTSGSAPGSLGQAASFGSKNPTTSGDLFARYYVNPFAVGYSLASSSSSQTNSAFGVPLYATLYPGTQITSPFSSTTASITSRPASIVPGFAGSSTGIGTGLGVSTRPAAAYTTVIGFKYRPTPSGEFLANLGDVLARSSDLADTKIQLILDGPTVVLRGNVSDWEQRRLAENLLKLTPGVNGVKNELVVLEAPVTPKAGQ